jgi:oligopeptide transport system substrate-binding protein
MSTKYLRNYFVEEGQMNKRYLLMFIGFLIIISTLLVGCPAATTTSPSPIAASPTPTVAQNFVTNLAGEPATIDPNKASWANQLSIIFQVFRGLLGFKADLSLEAVTATEIPSTSNGGISADGLTYTFKLRPDVTWSDGKKVVAKDYEYSIKRMLSPEIASEYASFYFDIAGAADYNASADKDAAAKASLRGAIGAKALNDSTLEIKLAQPRPTFLQIMALWPAYPVREDIITQFGDQWTEAPNYIGNGPFIMTEWVHQDHFTFKPNPNYWGSDKAKLSAMTYKMITDQQAGLAAYKNNELQLSQIPAGSEKATLADPALSKEIVRYNLLQTWAFQFNVTKAPFDNKLVRQAFSCAIDRAAFINNVRGGVGKVAYSWIPPGMPGYDANLGKDYDFNPTKAKDLLAQAGYSDISKLPAITFTYSNTGQNPTIAQFLQGQIKDNLGITITLDPQEPKAAVQFINAGKHQWAWFGWGADYPDPDNWLPDVFGTGGGNNHTLYSNPQFDTLAAQAKKELDNTKRLQMWADAQKMVMDDAPIITAFYQERLWLLKPGVKGLQTTGMDGQIPGDHFYFQLNIAQ